MSNSDYPWDPYSNQPHVIKNKEFKRALYRKGARSSLKTFLYIPILPLLALRLLFISRYRIGQRVNNIGLCVNRTETPKQQVQLSNEQTAAIVEELGIEDLLIRVPLSDIENLDSYVEFARQFKGKKLLINVLQDRRHIVDKEMLERSLRAIFDAFSDLTQLFQIGNSINRRKWAFVSTKEYFHFFEVAQKLRDASYPSLKLLGGNIIDFELPNFARSVFHGSKIKYDGIAIQLYVDRRGAPESSQFGFDLVAKIKWFFDMTWLSRKSSNKLYITETNWPLEGTEPFAPAVGDCMVDEEHQAAYLVRYYLLMLATGKIEKCYWHQLIAPGYGLIDNRGDTIRKRKAFYCLKVLYSLFNDAEVLSAPQKKSGLHTLSVRNHSGTVRAIWDTEGKQNVAVQDAKTILSATGETLSPESNGDNKSISVSGEPIYVLDYVLEESIEDNQGND